MLPNRNAPTYQTKSLTWWANERPEVEDLLQALLERRRSKPATLSKKKSKTPVFVATISFHDHGNAEDFHFGRLNFKKGTVQCELDLTRIAAHGRKQRLNCAMQESSALQLKEIPDTDRVVLLKPEEYDIIREYVINKLH